MMVYLSMCSSFNFCFFIGKLFHSLIVFTVLGVGGPLEAKSGKQKNVTKSSTEAELVALSDHAGRGINLQNIFSGQG